MLIRKKSFFFNQKLTGDSSRVEGLFYIFIPKAYRRLLPLRRLILYIIYQKLTGDSSHSEGLQETSPTQRAYSIYFYQRLTGDSSHSEGLFYIFLPKAYRRLLSLRRLILYIYTKGLPETPPTQKVFYIYLYQRLKEDSSHSEGFF